MMVDAEQVAVESMEEDAVVRLAGAYRDIEILRSRAAADATHIEELENKLVKYAAKHGRATTLIGSLQRELKALREKQKDVIDHAIKFAGNACERHLEAAKGMGFPEFVEKHPASCSWCLDERAKALTKVWSFLWDRFLDNTGMELYGDAFQELGEKAGLLHQVPFDPEVHGEGVESDPGDPIYVLTELGRSCYQKPADEAG